MSFLRRHKRLPGLILIGPAAVWVILGIVLPTIIVLRLSTRDMVNFELTSDWTLSNFSELLGSDPFKDALVNSLRNGVYAAIGAVVLSVPLAHFLRFVVRRHKVLLLGMVVVALWMGYLLRIFGWRILLGTDGIVNSFLQDVGLIDHPLSFLLFSQFGVTLAQVQLAMPFAFIPIYAAMERLPRSALLAAADLGASRTRSFLFVELPLIARGVAIGATFAFILAFGDFFAPAFVGAPSAQTLGKLAADNFRSIIDWPYGAAVGVVMMVVVLVVLFVSELVPRLVGMFRRGDA
jgi:spermidine/putrescine transport system permease protein